VTASPGRRKLLVANITTSAAHSGGRDEHAQANHVQDPAQVGVVAGQPQQPVGGTTHEQPGTDTEGGQEAELGPVVVLEWDGQPGGAEGSSAKQRLGQGLDEIGDHKPGEHRPQAQPGPTGTR
jgi:hypothetical protein